jgi:nickel/cobalt exporter
MMGYSDISLTAAFFLGALHAFWPGHGKAVLAAYLVGTRGRIVDAIGLGLLIAITHTFTVIVLGVIIKIAYSKVMAAVVQPGPPDSEPIPVPGAKIIQLVAGVLILGVGIWLILGGKRITGHEHEHHHHHHDEHKHGLWQILVLGISGGMVPCAEGIALLLMAVAAGQTGRGLVLVLAFSSGIALTIVSIGIVITRLTSLAEHLIHRTGKWVNKLPILSGSIISILGLYSIVKVLIAF